MSFDETRIDAILDAWETARREGHEPALTEWVDKHDELYDELLTRIEQLKEFERFDQVDTWPSHLRREIGAYTILDEIARGATSVVYRAKRTETGDLVAIKLLNPDRMNRAGLARFHREVSMLRQLDGTQIARVLDSGVANLGAGPQPYLVMPLIEGEPLDRYVFDRRLAMEARVELISRIARTIAVAHRLGIVHRDLKPANILVTEAGVPWVVDLGLARPTSAREITNVGSFQTTTAAIVGTLPYMSPEQAHGFGAAVDGRSDIYSLCVLAYLLLSGELPIDTRGCSFLEAHQRIQRSYPRSLSSTNISIARPLSTIIEQGLAKDPRNRYASMEDLADDLDRYLRHEPVRARRLSPPVRVWCAAKAHPSLAISVTLIAVTMFVATAVSVGFAMRARDAQRATETALRDWMDQADRAEREEKRALRVTGHLQVDRALKLAYTRPSAAIAMLEDPVVCPPEHRGFAWGVSRHFADQVRHVVTWDAPVRLAAPIGSGDAFVLVDDNNDILVWQAASRTARIHLRASDVPSRILHVACTRDGRHLAVAHENGVVAVANLESQQWQDQTVRLESCPFVIGYRSDGALVIVRRDGAIQLRHRISLDVIDEPVTGLNRIVTAASVSASSDRLAVSLGDGTLELWDTRSLTCQKRSVQAASQLIVDDTRNCIYLINDRTISEQPWDVDETRMLLREEYPVGSIAIGGRNALAIATESRVVLRRVTSTGELDSTSYERLGPVRQVAVSQDDRYLAVLSHDGVMRIYATMPRIFEHLPRGDLGTALARLPNGSRFAVGATQGSVVIYDASRNELVAEVAVFVNPVTVLCSTRDGQSFFAASTEGEGAIVDVAWGTVVKRMSLFDRTARPHAAAFTEDDQAVIVTSVSGHVNIVHRDRGTVEELPAHLDSLCAAPGARRDGVAVADDFGDLILFDHRRGVVLERVGQTRSRVTRLGISQDGSAIMCLTDAGIELFGLGQEQTILRSHVEVQAAQIALSPDRKTLAHVDYAGSLSLWDVDLGVRQMTLDNSFASYTNLCFSEDGRSLVATTNDGSIVVWRAVDGNGL